MCAVFTLLSLCEIRPDRFFRCMLIDGVPGRNFTATILQYDFPAAYVVWRYRNGDGPRGRHWVQSLPLHLILVYVLVS